MEATGNLDGHLGEGTEVKGTLRFEGAVRIDGKFSGKIISPATLILGPGAAVDGELQVAQLEVHGVLKGTVHARERVTIHSSGKVEADLKTQRLVIEPGAFFQGRCEMAREQPLAAQSVPKPGKVTAPAGSATGAPPKVPSAPVKSP